MGAAAQLRSAVWEYDCAVGRCRPHNGCRSLQATSCPRKGYGKAPTRYSTSSIMTMWFLFPALLCLPCLATFCACEAERDVAVRATACLASAKTPPVDPVLDRAIRDLLGACVRHPLRRSATFSPVGGGLSLVRLLRSFSHAPLIATPLGRTRATFHKNAPSAPSTRPFWTRTPDYRPPSFSVLTIVREWVGPRGRCAPWPRIANGR
eukprot:scaffold18906_cov122-Isochrysis_galbana.AAC.3